MRGMRSTALPLLASGAMVLAAACGDTGQGGGAGAGAVGTLDGPDVMLNAVTEDVFAVGSVGGGDWDTFGSVRSVAFDNDGRLHIFDSQADHILVVGPDGSLVRTVGGPGEGPGEFGTGTRAIIVARDGSYTVLGIQQFDLIDSDGTFVRRVSGDVLMSSDLALPDGRLVATDYLRVSEFFASRELPESEGRPVHLVPLDDSEPEVHYTAWELPEDPAASDGASGSDRNTFRMSAGRAYEPGLHMGVLTDGRIALADSIGYRIKLFGLDGSVGGVIERPIAPLAVDEAIREAARERYRAQDEAMAGVAGRSPIRFEREGVEALVFADEVPVIADIVVDWDDRIWVTRTDEVGADDGPTDIVTPDGRYIGTLASDGLRTPDAFGPNSLIAYIERDEMDVPSVRVVRLVSLEPEG